MFISYSEVSIKNPDNSGQALPFTYVCCREQGEDGACWHLLTSEKVASAADARRIVSHYERRWLIEEYHKAWKSGGICVESLRMQTRDNLDRSEFKSPKDYKSITKRMFLQHPLCTI